MMRTLEWDAWRAYPNTPIISQRDSYLPAALDRFPNVISYSGLMKIHEYQAKAVLSKYGVTVPRGEVAFTPEEVHDIAKRLGGPVSVVKAQIHAGGRGKAGGVKLTKSGQEAENVARELLGKTLVTYQTGPDGQKISRLLVEE